MYENTTLQKEPEVYVALDRLDKIMSALDEAVSEIDRRTGFVRLPSPVCLPEETAAGPSHRSNLVERIYGVHDAANSLRNRVNQIIEELEI